jgi:hypothetical protein
LTDQKNRKVILINRQGSPRKCGEELNHDGTADATEEMKRVWNRGSNILGLPLALLAVDVLDFVVSLPDRRPSRTSHFSRLMGNSLRRLGGSLALPFSVRNLLDAGNYGNHRPD